MNPRELRTELQSMTISEPVKERLLAILDGAIARNLISETEKSELLALLDLEVESNTIESDALEKMAENLGMLVTDVDEVLNSADTQIQEVATTLESTTPTA